jgi:hypothetical protein
MRIRALAAGAAQLRTGDKFALTTREVPGDWKEVAHQLSAAGGRRETGRSHPHG